MGEGGSSEQYGPQASCFQYSLYIKAEDIYRQNLSL
jgi:hypothetical protein